MAKITKRTVDSLRPGEIAWDGEMPGFGVRRRSGNARTYIFKYRFGTSQYWFKIGRHGAPWTVEAARRRALALLGELAEGRNPAAKEEGGETLVAFAGRYLRDYAEPHKKLRSVEEDRRNLKNHILPTLGSRSLNEITRAHVARFHLSLKETPIAANRCLALLSTMFTLAARWGMVPDGASNPCRTVEKFRENRRERFLSGTELAALGEALASAERDGTETTSAIAAIRLLALLGARRNEILTARWEHVDFERGYLRLADSKSGQKTMPLNAPALQILSQLPRIQGNPHLITGQREGGHLTDLERPWRRIRDRAGLTGVRLHDLRHSHASVGAAAGLSLPMIGALLGHTQAATTQRYAHLAADPLRQASELIGKRIAAAMDSGRDGGAEVVPLKRSS